METSSAKLDDRDGDASEPSAKSSEASGPRRRWDVAVCLGLGALVSTVYLPYALNAGWYYDDWAIYAQLQDAPSRSFSNLYEACAAGGQQRSLSCAYHAAEFGLFGDHRTAYHLASMAFLLLVAVLGYAVLRRCRATPAWAGVTAALFVLFPGSDSTRLWAVGSIAQYVIAVQLLAVLLAIIALRTSAPRRSAVLHVVAAALSLLAMASYEITIPLVALNGLIYLAAFRHRRVLWRGGVDLGLACGFVVYRIVLNPVSPESGFVVERTARQSIDHAGTLLGGAWDTWSTAFAPASRPAAIGIAALLAVVGLVAIRDRPFRRRVAPWAGTLVLSVVASAAAVLTYITANDSYVPALGGTFNRLNATAALPYCLAFVTLLGLLFELVRRFTPGLMPAIVAVAIVTVGVGWHQAGISTNHKRAWEESWRVQSAALDGYANAVQSLPADSAILGFDTPTWESSYIPVFSASWDLRGALDFTTAVDPPTAVALSPEVLCGPDAVVLGGQPFMPYRGGPPVYFVSPARGQAVRIRSQAACDRRIEKWGRSPFFGKSVTRANALG